MSTVFQMLGASFILVIGMMLILWCIYLFRRNAGIVDIGWALGYVMVVWAYFSLADGDIWRRLLIAVLVSIWGLRLAYHLLQRFLISPEDPRYQAIREGWGKDRNDFKFLMMYLFQGVLVLIISIPFLIISLSNNNWSYFEFAGFCIWGIGVAGEAFADYQLANFKEKSSNEGKVCQVGLWKVSRHPNYFFEWIVWIGYFFIALPAPGGWIAIVSPLIMLYLLTQYSGIPIAEDEALRSKGDAYREYQKTTSSFIPWFPFRKKG